jgi:hypothetical protein
MLVWQAQAQSDLLRVVGRLQSVLNYQLALALQKTLGDFLQPTEQLSALLLIAVCERALDSVCMGSEIVRGVLVVQVGQAIQNLLPSTAWTTASETQLASGFLINTVALMLPSMLELVTPVFMRTDYVQNAISVCLFQYAASTRTLLTRVHFGVPPAYICLLAFLLSHRVLSDSQASGVLTLFQYVGRALHMLLVDWFLGSVVASTHELSQLLQMSMLTMLVVIVDELQLDRLSLMRDVRGYLLYRIAGELQELGVLSMDGSSALSAALLAFCAHTAMQKMALYSRLGSALTDVLLIACVNVVTQNASSGAGADAAQQFTRVGVVCILTYKVNALLVS